MTVSELILKVWLPLAVVTPVLDFGLMYVLDGTETMKQTVKKAIGLWGVKGYVIGTIVADIIVPPFGLAAIVWGRVKK